MHVTIQPFQEGDLKEGVRGWYRGRQFTLAQNKELGIRIYHMTHFHGLTPHHDAPLIVDNGGSLTVLIDSKGRIGLIRELRPQLTTENKADKPLIYKIDGQVCWELPGGMSDYEESREQTANRETLEETGIQVTSLQPLGDLCSNPPLVAKKDSYYWATAPKNWKAQVKARQASEPECAEFRFFTRKQIWKLIRTGALYDTRTIAALYLYFDRKKMFVEFGPQRKKGK